MHIDHHMCYPPRVSLGTMTDGQVKYFHMLDLCLLSYVHILNSTLATSSCSTLTAFVILLFYDAFFWSPYNKIILYCLNNEIEKFVSGKNRHDYNIYIKPFYKSGR